MGTNDQVARELQQIKERNRRVEADKAWETSAFRIMTIAIMTYIVIVIFLYVIGGNNIFLSALIPTAGFILSTQSLPFLKRWWTKYHYKK